MKKHSFLWLVVFALNLTGCEREQSLIDPSKVEFFFGDDFITTSVDAVTYEDIFRLTMFGLKQSIFSATEQLKIGYIPCLIGRHHHPWVEGVLYNMEARYVTLVSDGDVLGDVFHIVPNDTFSYVEVTEINADCTCAKGNFQLKMVFDSARWPKIDNSLPDTIYITEGKFDVKMENYD